MNVKRKMIGESEHAEWGADEWADACFEVPAEFCEGLIVIASGTVAGVRFVHAVLFADYDPEQGWSFEHGIGGADEEDVALDVEWWRPIPELPEEIRKEIGPCGS